MGKSTMAGWLCSNGAELFADDLLRVDCEPDAAWAYAGSTEARLRIGARPLADCFQAPVARRETVDGRLALSPPLAAADRLPLGRLVLPRPSRSVARVELAMLEPTQAVLALASCPRVLGWTDRSVQRAQFERAAELVARVPVFSAIVPWGPPFRPAVVDELQSKLDAAPTA
jgi:hypothetical protein